MLRRRSGRRLRLRIRRARGLLRGRRQRLPQVPNRHASAKPEEPFRLGFVPGLRRGRVRGRGGVRDVHAVPVTQHDATRGNRALRRRDWCVQPLRVRLREGLLLAALARRRRVHEVPGPRAMRGRAHAALPRQVLLAPDDPQPGRRGEQDQGLPLPLHLRLQGRQPRGRVRDRLPRANRAFRPPREPFLRRGGQGLLQHGLQGRRPGELPPVPGAQRTRLVRRGQEPARAALRRRQEREEGQRRQPGLLRPQHPRGEVPEAAGARRPRDGARVLRALCALRLHQRPRPAQVPGPRRHPGHVPGPGHRQRLLALLAGVLRRPLHGLQHRALRRRRHRAQVFDRSVEPECHLLPHARHARDLLPLPVRLGRRVHAAARRRRHGGDQPVGVVPLRRAGVADAHGARGVPVPALRGHGRESPRVRRGHALRRERVHGHAGLRHVLHGDLRLRPADVPLPLPREAAAREPALRPLDAGAMGLLLRQVPAERVALGPRAALPPGRALLHLRAALAQAPRAGLRRHRRAPRRDLGPGDVRALRLQGAEPVRAGRPVPDDRHAGHRHPLRGREARRRPARRLERLERRERPRRARRRAQRGAGHGAPRLRVALLRDPGPLPRAGIAQRLRQLQGGGCARPGAARPRPHHPAEGPRARRVRARVRRPRARRRRGAPRRRAGRRRLLRPQRALRGARRRGRRARRGRVPRRGARARGHPRSVAAPLFARPQPVRGPQGAPRGARRGLPRLQACELRVERRLPGGVGRERARALRPRRRAEPLRGRPLVHEQLLLLPRGRVLPAPREVPPGPHRLRPRGLRRAARGHRARDPRSHGRAGGPRHGRGPRRRRRAREVRRQEGPLLRALLPPPLQRDELWHREALLRRHGPRDAQARGAQRGLPRGARRAPHPGMLPPPPRGLPSAAAGRGRRAPPVHEARGPRRRGPAPRGAVPRPPPGPRRAALAGAAPAARRDEAAHAREPHRSRRQSHDRPRPRPRRAVGRAAAAGPPLRPPRLGGVGVAVGERARPPPPRLGRVDVAVRVAGERARPPPRLVDVVRRRTGRRLLRPLPLDPASPPKAT
mmetsp:Transcript_15081/g.48980  ORF Transcript_15081/g.48980 Transcript_15081/m.48980 type:complete len:1070 (+) Transcript_15081:2704-5913(+)